MIISQKKEIACLLLFVVEMAKWAVARELALPIKKKSAKRFSVLSAQTECFDEAI
jgi:hypothetical protein